MNILHILESKEGSLKKNQHIVSLLFYKFPIDVHEHTSGNIYLICLAHNGILFQTW